MNPPPAPMPLKTRLVRRLLPLAILASAVALVAIQISRAVTHQVSVELQLESGLADRLTRLDLQVIGPRNQVVSLTQFHFDEDHRPEPTLSHTLQLPKGSYRLVFETRQKPPDPARIRRNLRVDGDATVRFRLP